MKLPFTNHGTAPIYVGAVLVRPGETRNVDPRYIPGAVVESAATPPPESKTIEAFLAGSAKDVIAALAGLSDADLALAEAAETADKARKSVLAEMAELKIKRAAG